MNKIPTLVSARSGLLLIALFVCTLIASPLHAHDVHDASDEHPPEATGLQANDSVRELLRRFRATGDDAWLDRAWMIVEPQLTGGDVDVLIDAAFVAQARHEFDRALEFTQQALAVRHNLDQAWLLLASIHLVRGETTAARHACDELRRATWLVIIGCHARVAHAEGDAMEVRGQLDRLIAATPESGVDSGILAWVLGIAGDLAVATGDSKQAVNYFLRSLAISESTQVRAALVDVLIVENKLNDAQRVLDGGAAALPLDIRRMIVAKLSGRERDVAAAIHRADHEFRTWIAAEDWLHAREMTRFYLDVVHEPALARRLAEINIALQREPEDQRLDRRTLAVIG